MKKRFLFLLLLLAGAVLCAGEIQFKNANFDITFDTLGATVKTLIHDQVNWNAAGPKRQGNSFCDSRIGRTVEPKLQFNENFAALEYKLASWKTYKTTGWADVTFSVKGTVFDWLRLNKTYKIRTGDLLEVVYEFNNTSDKPQNFSFSPRWFMHRTDKENFFWQPTAKGIRKLKQQKSFFFVKQPPQTYIAVGADDNSGLLFEFPADATAGIMNWFIKGRSASTELFTDEITLPAKGKKVFSIKLHFTKDLNKLIAQKKFTAKPLKGKIPPMVDKMNQGEDRSYHIRTLKHEVPAETTFFDIELKPQYKDSWRAVKLPDNIPLDKIAVFRLENGAPSFDMPVGYVLNGRELLLKVPGFHPEGSNWRSSIKDGLLFEKFGARKVVGLHDFNCRIYYDRTDGLKLKEKAPAGGELILNGSFDIPGAKNPAMPKDHPFVLNKNFHAKYLKSGGTGNSPCLQGGELVFQMIPEAGMTYNVSFMYKNQGGDSMTRCYFSFYDAEGKRLAKSSVMMASSKNSFEWKKVTKKVYAPAEAAFMAVSVSRSSKKPARVCLDDLSVKPAPLSCSKITPLEQGRKELIDMWGVPLKSLESLSLDVANPHKKWFHPAEKPVDVLYLPFEHERGRLLRDKRIVVELAQRMQMNIKVIPVLRKIISSTGIYSIYVATFGKELSLYSYESLKAITKAPKVVLITSLNPKQFSKDLENILAAWQKQGTHFIVFSGNFLPKLKGKPVKAPVDLVMPIMKEVKRNRAFDWYKNGKSYVVECTPFGKSNPLVPVHMEDGAARHRYTYISRDYPWWEYQNLSKLQFIRFLAGVKPVVRLVSGNEKALTLKSTKDQNVTVEVTVSNMFREVKKELKIKAALKAASNTVALPAVDLPAGTFVADVRILNGEGKVLDAGAFRIDRSSAVKAQLTLKNANGIFPQGENLVFDLKLANLPASSVIEAEVEDTHQRIIARKTFPAKAAQTLTLELPAPRTILNNLIFRVKNNGKLLAEGIREFSSPAGPTDFTEFFGLTWGFQRYLARELELDGITSNSPYSANVQDIYRAARYENLAASPMGLASRRSSEYRGDRKTDPVRSPCFHDPAYLAKNTALLDQHYGKRNLLGYYDIRDFWSGDEQFLGSTVCYSPHCLKVFREELKKEYKTIGALNKEWNTSFASFDKVIPQQLDEIKSRENLAPWLDHKMFMAATFAWGQFRSHLGDLRKYNPHARMGASGTQKPGYGYDWVQYMKHCRVMSYYSGIQVKLIHDIGGKDILAGRWRTYCYPETDQETYCVSPMWIGLLRGSNMAAIWPPSMTNGDGTPTRNVRFAKAVMDELRQGITKLWLTGTAKPQIALLYSQSSLFTAMGTFGDSEWQNTQSSWLKLLDDMKYDCRYLSYEEVAEKGISSQYKLLILPAAVSLSDKEAAQIEKFVKQGGTVIADYAPGRYDGHGKRRTSAVLNRIFTPYSGPIDVAYEQLPQLGGRFKVAEKGIPFIQEKAYGKGRTILFNFSVSDYHFIQLGGMGGEVATSGSADAKLQLAMRKIVKKALERAGVAPCMAVLDEKGNDLPCMALMREDGGTLTAAVYKEAAMPRTRGVLPPGHDLIDRKKGHAVTVKLPVKGHVYDYRTGKYFGETDTFKSYLVPGIANFYSIQKKRVAGLDLQAPASVTAGSSVTLKFTARGAEGAQVFNVNVCGPDGKSLRFYRKNFRTAGGSGVYTFQIPFNAPKGKWQIRAAHVNTGIRKNINVTVK